MVYYRVKFTVFFLLSVNNGEVCCYLESYPGNLHCDSGTLCWFSVYLQLTFCIKY